MDKILGFLEASSGVIQEVSENKEVIRQKIENARELLETLVEGRDSVIVEPNAGDAPEVEFSNDQDVGRSGDSIIVTTEIFGKFGRTYKDFNVSTRDTANNTLYLKNVQGAKAWPIISVKPLKKK